MQSKITILGSGTCLSSYFHPLDFRHSAAHLVQYDNLNILLDCSEGVRQRLSQIQFDYFNLDAIMISHFHPDHFNMVSLIQSLSARAIKEKQKKKLTICGPKNIEQLVSRYWQIKNQKMMNVPFLEIDFYEFVDGQKLSIGSVQANAYRVIHTDMEAYALRLQLGDVVCAYSGDSGVCDGLVAAAKNADIFICEAALNIDDRKGDTAEHLTPHLVGDIAVKANAKKVVLVHYNGKDSKEEMMQDLKLSGYSGEIHVANDFDVLSM